MQHTIVIASAIYIAINLLVFTYFVIKYQLNKFKQNGNTETTKQNRL